MADKYFTGTYRAFDITGPVMVGPSSSHTAGAARLGKLARILAQNSVKRVVFQLYGSFAQTYRGHGTDKALLAGILGLDPWDLRLREAFALADELGVEYYFEPIVHNHEEGMEHIHPNTVRFLITNADDSNYDIVGCSIGGGKVRITRINGINVDFTGENPILVTHHEDGPGIVAAIASALYNEQINIGNMQVSRKRRSNVADMYLELDSDMSDAALQKIRAIPGMLNVILLRKIDENNMDIDLAGEV